MTIRYFYAVVLTCTLLLSCAVEDSGPPTSGASAALTSFATTTQGAQVASATAQARELILTSAQMFKDLGDIGLGLMVPSISSTPMTSVCSDGGTYDYSGTYSAPDSYSLSITFNGCRQGGYQYVGPYALQGTPTGITVTLGSGSTTFNIFNFNPSYTVLLAYLKAGLTFTMSSSGTLPTTACTISASGPIETFDYFLLNTYNMTFSRLNTDITLTTNANLDLTATYVANGTFLENWAAGTSTARITFSNFTVTRTRNNAAIPPSVNFTSDDRSVSGGLFFTFRPLVLGYSGTFTVVTDTPIHYVYSPSLHTTQGTVVTNATATTLYNAGGDIDILVANDPLILNYPDEYSMMKTADFAAMEQDKPPLLGPTTVSSVTGSTMAVTLTWTGPAGASTSDMDLHVKYYATTAPTAASAETWHIDWHQGKTCANPIGLSFSAAFDIGGSGTGVCDVGLDFDDTNGYGPEHITALSIPSGYYVVSVNSYALSVAEYPTTLYLSLHIGDNIYGPYIGTVSGSDGESTSPSAWYRVADVRVNLSGTVDVITPDLTLNPWH